MALKFSFIFSCFLLLTIQVYGDNCPPDADAPAPLVYTPPQSPSTPPQAPATPPIVYTPPQSPSSPPPQPPSSPPLSVAPQPPPSSPPPFSIAPQPAATSPTYAPPQSPSPPPPESPTTYPPLPVIPSKPHKHGFCVVECMKRCRTLPAYTGRTRVCVRLCSRCCKANNKCVPGPATTCPAWDTIVYHGVTVKCP